MKHTWKYRITLTERFVWTSGIILTVILLLADK